MAVTIFLMICRDDMKILVLVNWSYGFLPMLFKLEWFTTFEHGVKSLLNVFWRPFLDPLITQIHVSDYQSNQGRATYLRRLDISKSTQILKGR